MKVCKYHLKSDELLTVFEFISGSLKGAIRKLFHFQLTYTPRLFNLAFGDKYLVTGELAVIFCHPNYVVRLVTLIQNIDEQTQIFIPI